MAEKPNGIDSDIAKWFARGVIPAIVVAALSIFSWNANRVVGTLDAHSIKLEAIVERVNTVDLHLNSVDNKVDLFRQFLDLMKRQSDIDGRSFRDAEADHEARLRQLEGRR